MAKIKATVIAPFSYKKKQYKPGDEVAMPADHAAKYEKLDYVKLEAEKKVVANTKEKKDNAGPGK